MLGTKAPICFQISHFPSCVSTPIKRGLPQVAFCHLSVFSEMLGYKSHGLGFALFKIFKMQQEAASFASRLVVSCVRLLQGNDMHRQG
jgi:hypothetical protein